MHFIDISYATSNILSAKCSTSTIVFWESMFGQGNVCNEYNKVQNIQVVSIKNMVCENNTLTVYERTVTEENLCQSLKAAVPNVTSL